MFWQYQPHEMAEKLPLGPLEMGQSRQYTLEESNELSSCTGKLGNFTLEDDSSCVHLLLNKNCPKY
jgi:predicted nucleic acid-binding Zn finger protein